MTGIELLTPRLRLRQWRDEDLEQMAELNEDPEVYEFLSRRPDRAETAAGIERSIAHFERYGFGHFAVEGRAGDVAGQLLGFAGVRYPTFIPEVAHRPELGYRLGRPFWGRGYATEASQAARDDAFERVGLSELISLIDPGNRRSQRVAEKMGMSPGEVILNPMSGLEIVVWGRRAPGG